MKKSNDLVHPANKNFRYLIWTFVGIICFVALASAYVYVTDTGIDMDDQAINNVSDPVNDQDAATKAYVDDNAGGLIRKHFTLTTEFSTTSANYVDVTSGSFTLTTSANAIILGVYVTADLKTDVGSTGDMSALSLKVTGSSLGTKYLVSTASRYGYDWRSIKEEVSWDSVEDWLLGEEDSDYLQRASSGFTPLVLPDTSTTFTFRLKAISVTTAYVDNLDVTIIYSDSFTDV